MLPGCPPAKKARSVALAGGEEDPRGVLRIEADAKAKAKAGAGHVALVVAPKGKATAKHVAVLVAPKAGLAPPPKPKAKGKGKGKGRGKAEALALPLPPPSPPPAPPSPDNIVIVPAASSSSSSKAAAPPAPAAGVRRPGKKKPFIPTSIGEGEVVYEEYREFGFGKLYRNWIFKCPHHHGCERTVGVIPRNIEEHGILEPLALLHVWRDVPPGPRGHRLTNPTAAAVAAFYGEHQDELETLGDLFGVATP